MDKRIDYCEQDGDGFWIFLRPGFACEGEHAIVEDCRENAAAKMRSVRVCECAECKQEIAALERIASQVQAKLNAP